MNVTNVYTFKYLQYISHFKFLNVWSDNIIYNKLTNYINFNKNSNSLSDTVSTVQNKTKVYMLYDTSEIYI